MIVRISAEGQYRLPDSALDAVDTIDNRIVGLIAAGDVAGFRKEMAAMFDMVRQHGTPVGDEELVASDVMLPPADITMEEARVLFAGEGVIPG
jgi:hypothetical protein